MTQDQARSSMGIVGYTGSPNGFITPFSGENVSMVIDNSGTGATDSIIPVEKLIALSPGWYKNAEQVTDFSGKRCDGIIDDGIFIPATTTSTAVIATGQGGSIVDMVGTFTETPCRIKGVRIICSNPDQLNQEFQVLELRPKGANLLKTVTPNALKSENDFDQTRASVSLIDDMIILGKDRTFVYRVLPGVKVTVVFFFADRMSQTAQLENAVATGLI